MRSRASLLPAAAFNASASPGRRVAAPPQPVSTGFMTPTRRPRVRSAEAMPRATNVLPTPVSVPVMKRPAIRFR